MHPTPHLRNKSLFASFSSEKEESVRARRAALLALALSAAAAAPPAGKPVLLTAQPGSHLEATARRLMSTDITESSANGAPPLLLVGSARLSTDPGPAALFVQVQSADLCGSAGCSTAVYVKRGAAWHKVLDSVSGPIRVAPGTHRGMHDLLVHGHDRWIWNGTAYADTLPVPDVKLK
jgi:hypothetical protein